MTTNPPIQSVKLGIRLEPGAKPFCFACRKAIRNGGTVSWIWSEADQMLALAHADAACEVIAQDIVLAELAIKRGPTPEILSGSGV